MTFYNETSGYMNKLVVVTVGAVFIIMMLTITVFLGSQLENAIDVDQQQTIYVENETVNTGIFGTWVPLNHYPIVSNSDVVRNISSGAIFLRSGNYSMNYTEGKIKKI